MKIRIGFFFILLAVALFITHSLSALASLLAAFLHELGHILAARISKIKFREIRLTPFGASLIPSADMGSFSSEIFICAAGPSMNFLCAAITFFVFSHTNQFLNLFILSSLFLGTLNLLPVYEFDGGRILFAAIEGIFSFKSAKNILSVSSFLVVFSLWTLSLYFIIKSAASLSLFVFSCSLFAKLFISNNNQLII